MKVSVLGISVFMLFIIPFKGVSQNNAVENIAREFKFIAGNFAKPAATGVAYQSGGGWFSSAKAIDAWSFEFSVHANVLFIPSKARQFTIANADFDNLHEGENILSIKGAEKATIPSAFGGDTDVFFQGEIFGNSFEFQALEGIDRKVIPHPFVQAAVGLPLGTEVAVRFLPQIMIDGAEFSTYGIGLKHNLNQYFFYPQPTDFQFAALVAYTKFNVDYMLLNPVEIPEVANMESVGVNGDLWLFELISSKAFFNSGWEVFGAVGAINSSFDYAIGGSGIALPYINSELGTLDNDEIEVKGDLGFNYTAGRFKLSSMISIGEFLNYNLGLHFRL